MSNFTQDLTLEYSQYLCVTSWGTVFFVVVFFFFAHRHALIENNFDFIKTFN